MILYETISAAIATGQWCAPGKPYGFAVSDAADSDARLADVRAAWPDLDLDGSHTASEADARQLGFL